MATYLGQVNHSSSHSSWPRAHSLNFQLEIGYKLHEPIGCPRAAGLRATWRSWARSRCAPPLQFVGACCDCCTCPWHAQDMFGAGNNSQPHTAASSQAGMAAEQVRRFVSCPVYLLFQLHRKQTHAATRRRSRGGCSMRAPMRSCATCSPPAAMAWREHGALVSCPRLVHPHLLRGHGHRPRKGSGTHDSICLHGGSPLRYTRRLRQWRCSQQHGSFAPWVLCTTTRGKCSLW